MKGQPAHNRTHGQSGTNDYARWNAIIQRCHSPLHPRYGQYGGRGISVCDRWRYSFANFMADVGPKPAGKSLDRIDNDGNYEPSNVRWATAKEQACNKRANIKLSHGGETLTVADWSRRTGLSKMGIHRRINRGWPVDLALTTPGKNNSESLKVRRRLIEEGRPQTNSRH